ncbi:hypothetical protein V8E53_011533 [Lactarius tabidus]
MRFQVRSSTQDLFYDVDLVNTTCTCSDFPRIEFCKHIASAQHFFGVGKVEPQGPTSQPSPIAPASLNTKNGNATYDMNGAASLISVTNEIIALSHELLMRTPKPEDISDTVKSLRSVSKHLAAVVASGTGDGPLLPEKERIAPNQHSWTETAQRMGVKRIKKRRGKVDSALTAEHIGEINRKRTRENEDPYGAGEQSGKRAKQDARSVAANSRARATVERRPTSPLPPPSSLPPRLLSRVPEPHPIPLSQPIQRSANPIPPPASFPPASLPASLPPPASFPASFPPPASLPPASLSRLAPLTPSASLPPRLASERAPGPFPPQAPYHPPPPLPFLTQPTPLSHPQFIQYQYPGFQQPSYAFYYPPNS